MKSESAEIRLNCRQVGYYTGNGEGAPRTDPVCRKLSCYEVSHLYACLVIHLFLFWILRSHTVLINTKME